MKADVTIQRYENDDIGLVHFIIEWPENWHVSAGPFHIHNVESVINKFLNLHGLVLGIKKQVTITPEKKG